MQDDNVKPQQVKIRTDKVSAAVIGMKISDVPSFIHHHYQQEMKMFVSDNSYTMCECTI